MFSGTICYKGFATKAQRHQVALRVFDVLTDLTQRPAYGGHARRRKVFFDVKIKIATKPLRHQVALRVFDILMKLPQRHLAMHLASRSGTKEHLEGF
jgi:hypothetical protein